MRDRRVFLLAVLLVAGAALGGFLLTAAGARGPGSGFHGYGPGMMGRYGSGASTGATLLIRHQRAHCHTWSRDGGPFRRSQRMSLRVGARLTVIDMDVMPHRLVQLSGPRVSMHNGTTMPMMGRYGSQGPGLMGHMGASTTVRFVEPGTYRFRTRAGEDYTAGIETTGHDNVLTLTVTVR